MVNFGLTFSVRVQFTRPYLKTDDAFIDPGTVISSQSNTRPSSDENKFPVSSNAITSSSSGDWPRSNSLVVVVISMRFIRLTNTSARRMFPVTVGRKKRAMLDKFCGVSLDVGLIPKVRRLKLVFNSIISPLHYSLS